MQYICLNINFHIVKIFDAIKKWFIPNKLYKPIPNDFLIIWDSFKPASVGCKVNNQVCSALQCPATSTGVGEQSTTNYCSI